MTWPASGPARGSLAVLVADEDTREVTLDLRHDAPAAMGRIRIRATVNGKPAAGLGVRPSTEGMFDEGEEPSTRARTSLDAEGEGEVEVAAGIEIGWELLSPAGLPIARAEHGIPAATDAVTEVVIAAHCGTLIVELPADATAT